MATEMSYSKKSNSQAEAFNQKVRRCDAQKHLKGSHSGITHRLANTTIGAARGSAEPAMTNIGHQSDPSCSVIRREAKSLTTIPEI